MKKLIPHSASLFIVLICLISLPTVLFAQSEKPDVGEGRKENAVYVKGITPARARSLVGVVFGITSISMGLAARKRTASLKKKAQSWALTALTLGVAAIVLSVAHLISTSGGFGTGGGKAGAIIALLLGVVGTTIATLNMRRSKKGEVI